MNITLTIKFDQAVLSLVGQAVRLLSKISDKENMIMATLEQDVAAVAANTDLMASIKMAFDKIEAQLLAMPGITPAMQTQIDGMFEHLTANNEMANAIISSVPPTVPTPPVA